jgi:hypothetical protein
MNSPPPKSRSGFALLLAIAVAAGVWLGIELDRVVRPLASGDSSSNSGSTTALESPGKTPSQGEPKDSSKPPTERTVASPPLDTNRLPPLNTSLPLATQMPTLLQRLQQGDPVAACRIAIDKIRCTSARLSGAFARDITKQAARGNSILGENRTIDFLANREEQLQAAADYCGDADDESLPEIQDFPKHALARLSTRQKVILALVRQDGSIARFPRDQSTSRMHLNGSSRFMLPQYLADNMLQFLQQGVANADPLALEGMLLMHYPFFDIGIARIPSVALPNPEAFARHAYLAQEVFGGDGLGAYGAQALLAIETSLPATRVSQLRTEARNLAVAWKSRAAIGPHASSLDNELSLSNLCTN